MSDPRSIDDDASVHILSEGRYTASLQPAWWGYAAAHGGYLACVLMRAMQAELGDAGRVARTMTTHFLRGPEPGPVEITVEHLRSGGKLSTLSARMLQDGRPVCMALAAFGVPFGDTHWSDLTMPAVPKPAEVPVQRRSNKVAIDQRFELRPCLGEAPFSGAARAHYGGWGRLAAAGPLSPCALTLLADGFWPSLFTLLSNPREAGACPTVELTVHFRQPHLPAPDPGPDSDFVLVDLRTRTLAEGYADESARLWSIDGTLLAESRQLAVRLQPKQ